MKILKTSALFALLSVCYFQSTAQSTTIPLNEPDYNRPRLFADLPEKFTINTADLDAILSLEEGSKVNRSIAAGFNLSGVVVSKADEANIKSIVIKSTSRLGAAFTVSRFKNAEGQYMYSGRMLSKNAGDVLVIEKDGANYVLRKKGYYDLVNE